MPRRKVIPRFLYRSPSGAVFAATMRACQEGGDFAVRTLSLLVILGLVAPAFAQDAAAPSPSANVDEVIVPGRVPDNIRVEIERLETAVYDRFNDLNSDDELDIHCFMRAPTGSNIPVRTCAPNFAVRAESAAGRKMLTDGRSGAGNNNNPAEQRARMEQKGRELNEEMQRIARDDEELLRSLVRLDELKQLQSRGSTARAGN